MDAPASESDRWSNRRIITYMLENVTETPPVNAKRTLVDVGPELGTITQAAKGSDPPVVGEASTSYYQETYKIIPSLPGYTIGDPLHASDAILCCSRAGTSYAMDHLRRGNCAFVMRSDGSFTYAVYEGWDERNGGSSLYFRVDDSGRFKVVRASHFCSLVKVPVLLSVGVGVDDSALLPADINDGEAVAGSARDIMPMARSLTTARSSREPGAHSCPISSSLPPLYMDHSCYEYEDDETSSHSTEESVRWDGRDTAKRESEVAGAEEKALFVQEDRTNASTGGAKEAEDDETHRGPWRTLRALPGYEIGDPLKAVDANLCSSNTEASAFAINELRPGDCSFVARKCGSLTYAVYEGWTEDDDDDGRGPSLSFRVDGQGRYKLVPIDLFSKWVRVPMLPLELCNECDDAGEEKDIIQQESQGAEAPLSTNIHRLSHDLTSSLADHFFC